MARLFSMFLLAFICLGSLAKQVNQEVIPIDSLEPLEINQERLNILQKASALQEEKDKVN